MDPNVADLVNACTAIESSLMNEVKGLASDDDLKRLNKLRGVGKDPEDVLIQFKAGMEQLKSTNMDVCSRAELNGASSSVDKTIKNLKFAKQQKKLIGSLLDQLDEDTALDLLFMCDNTGSMKSHVDSVRNFIDGVVKYLEANMQGLKIRLAYVGYREIGDHPQFETLDFSADVGGFKEFLKNVQFFGGGSPLADIEGGVNRTLDLDWTSEASQLIHIADYPTHGLKYHSGLYDAYPKGNPNGLVLGKLLKNLRERGVNYGFCHITEHTKKMVKVLNSELGEPGDERYIKEYSLVKPEDIKTVSLLATTSLVSKSFTKTARVGKSGPLPEIKLYKDRPVYKDLPELGGYKYDVEPPQTLSDIKAPLPRKAGLRVSVRIAENPFAKGGCRAAFYGTIDDVRVVFKLDFRPKKGVSKGGVDTKGLEGQAIARFLAKKFCDENKGKRIEFIPTSIVVLDDGRVLYSEAELKGNWIKFCNNHKNWSLATFSKTVASFLVWSYEVTNGYIMVSDLQGVVDSNSLEGGRKGYRLTDPAVLCKDMKRFQPTNTGEMGMKRLIASLVHRTQASTATRPNGSANASCPGKSKVAGNIGDSFQLVSVD